MVDGTGFNGVCLLGEAPDDKETLRGKPFIGPAGFRLERMVQQLGQRRDDFLLTNVCWSQPHKNREPTDQEIAQWRDRWEPLVRDPRIKVVVPLGNSALRAVLGADGIQGKRGYLWWSDTYGKWLLPTVHPAFILRGNAHWTAAWLRDVGMACEVAQSGPPHRPRRELTLDPTPSEASAWCDRWLAEGAKPLAFDIETPDKGTDEEEAEIRAGETGGQINRIGFAWRGVVTHALSIPWGAAYLPVVSALFSTATTTVVWNRHFDVPRLWAHGQSVINCHDAQEMWHVLHPDLPKRLEFVAPFLIPGQMYWKDQSWQRPAFYNATDAAVTIEAYEQLWGSGVEMTEAMEREVVLFQQEIHDDSIPF